MPLSHKMHAGTCTFCFLSFSPAVDAKGDPNDSELVVLLSYLKANALNAGYRNSHLSRVKRTEACQPHLNLSLRLMVLAGCSKPRWRSSGDPPSG
jgi:hypothetical protein